MIITLRRTAANYPKQIFKSMWGYLEGVKRPLKRKQCDQKEDGDTHSRRKFCEMWRFGDRGVPRDWLQYVAESLVMSCLVLPVCQRKKTTQLFCYQKQNDDAGEHPRS